MMFNVTGWAEGVAERSAIVVAAKEEAARAGHAQVDPDHMLLGLLAVGGDAAELLAGRGVTLARARAAMEEIQQRDLARIDVAAPAGRAPQTVRYSPDAIEPTEESIDAMMAEPRDGGDLPVLAKVLDDPAAPAARILAELGVDLTPREVRTAPRSAPPPAGAAGDAGAAHAGEEWSATYRLRVEAPTDSVWALLDDPTQRPRWDTAVATVDLTHDGAFDAQGWLSDAAPGRIARRLARRVDGRIRFEVVQREPGRAIEWRAQYPGDVPVERLRVELEPNAGGTTITLRHRRADRRGLLGAFNAWADRQDLRLKAQALGQVAGE